MLTVFFFILLFVLVLFEDLLEELAADCRPKEHSCYKSKIIHLPFYLMDKLDLSTQNLNC